MTENRLARICSSYRSRAGRVIAGFSRKASGDRDRPALPGSLPDGRHFLYLSWAGDPQKRGIYLGAFDSEERTLLVRRQTFAPNSLAPDMLLYIRDRSLVAQRVSLRNGAGWRRGTDRRRTARTRRHPRPGRVWRGRRRDSRVPDEQPRSRERVTLDRPKGSASEAMAAKASDISVSLSPDERRVAVTRLVSSPSEERLPGNIWLFDLARRVASRFTLDGAGSTRTRCGLPTGENCVCVAPPAGAGRSQSAGRRGAWPRGAAVSEGREFSSHRLVARRQLAAAAGLRDRHWC